MKRVRRFLRRYPTTSTYIILRLTVCRSSIMLAFVAALAVGIGHGFLTARRRQQVREGKREPRHVPTRKTVDPVRATKLAYPVVKDGRVLLHPLVQGKPYGVDDDARCAFMDHAPGSAMMRFMVKGNLISPEDHGPVPSLRCTCGFYALKDSQRRGRAFRVLVGLGITHWRKWRKKDPQKSHALLDVELLGRVVVCERGYRAARQRVLKVYLDGRCVTCAKAATGFFAGTFVVGPSAAASLTSTCGCQVPVRYSLQDVENMLGTEVAWDKDRQPLLTMLRRKR